ncbi:serine/threonine protein kinase [Alsobacter metallidurans]|uniref:Serine/threonine protein kinase n=1 Tax=Alsobacter metallidurans TaxID=340221 RepID=A0A917MI12_9HYPH|nr:serine/threonine-protein kinase [Alsobacter metallidurans]GGH20289.1 serine/threonine protein kinase [Alsobacter metallidurans]
MSVDDARTVVTPNVMPSGTRLNDIYEIDALIAMGGMGQVYRGHAIETGDPVAIKMIRTDLIENETALALFRREAAALHQLHHEAIVRYFVFSIDRQLQRAYLAMEFVNGEPLGTFVQTRKLDAVSALALMRRVADGLAAAHRAGIVHRDISPDNIIIPDGDVRRARIIDFGIAKNSLAEGTVVGDTFVGKYRYASPEQFGDFGGRVTGKTDIYSLGLVLAGCLLGKPLNMGQSLSEAVAQRRVEPDLSGVDATIRPLLAWMTQPDPSDRPADMAAVANWSPGVAPRAAPQKRDVAVSSPKHGRGGLLAGLSALAVVAGAGALLWWWLQPARTDVAGAVTTAERYALDFDGGPCVLLSVTDPASQTFAVDAYGARVEPFETFDKNFTDVFKADAKIDLRQITAAQCPAVTLLAGLKTPKAERADLKISAARVADGGALTAWVTSRQPWAALLRVDENGSVSVLDSGFGKNGRALQVPARRVKEPPGQPQLLVALAADTPIETVRSMRPDQSAESVFTAIAKDPAARKAGLTGSLAYFKVQ